MKISEIYTAIKKGKILVGDKGFVAICAIELLARAEGVPVAALNLAAPSFALAYPPIKRDLQGHWHGVSHYQAWRSCILDAQMWAAPGATDGDHWKSLARAERLGLTKSVSTLYDFANYLPESATPQDVSDNLILSTFNALAPQDQLRFRDGTNSLRRLFDCALAQQTGLMPTAKPSRLPAMRDHLKYAPMSAEISAARASFQCKNTVFGLDYIHRLACAAGMLNGDDDTLEDLRKAMSSLPDPAEVGVPPIKEKTLRAYINDVLFKIGGRDYRLTEIEQSWSDLRKAARAAGYETSALYNLSMPAAAQGMMPSEITPSWVEGLITYHKKRGCRATPTQCRIGCEQFDALRSVLPEEIFPTEPLGIRRTPPRMKQPPQSKDPVVSAWDALYVEIKQNALLTEKYKHLWYIRREAIKVSLTPQSITQNWLRQLQDTCPSDRRYALYGGIENLRAISGFQHLKPLRTRKQRHGGLPSKLAKELEVVLAEMGAAPSSSRQTKLAVGVLVERLGLDDTIGLQEICNIDLEAVGWGCSSSKAKAYSVKFSQLQKYVGLPWTTDWKTLQRIVREAGIGLLKNPVPKLLSWDPGPSPRTVTLEWAKKLDRQLRSTLLNGPHGRADLAKTMAGHVAAFDRLREIPEVATSGLMPEPIGPVR
ncbi:hypothetical protein HGG71_02265 [Rhodobacteraceae bacterium R_SAG2]|nr:hypothetical protein [Rhodobacteraceae bacterium R_SAG2]